MCTGEHLLLQIVNLTLLVSSYALNSSECAIIFVTRSDCHIVETAVRHPCQTHLVHSCWNIKVCGTIDIVLIFVDNLALIRGLVCIDRAAFLDARRGLERLLGAYTVSVVAGILQLLRLLQVAQLVVRDQQIASTI